MDTSLADVTNARHHHLPSSPCPYVEHLLLAGLHMLCSALLSKVALYREHLLLAGLRQIFIV